MTIFLDLAGSMVVRASMVTVMLGLTVTMNNALFESTQQTNAAATVATVGSIVYTDLNETVAAGFTTSTSNRMVFHADTSMGGGNLATITYFTTLDNSTGLYRLYRRVGWRSLCISDNLVNVSFQYFDLSGQATSTPASVNSIRVKLVAQVSGVSSSLSTTINDFKAFPPNLN
jgi:hypothetical protein